MDGALIRVAKTALRVSSNQFDEEIRGLIDAALLDLKIAGVKNRQEYDPLIQRAVILYCKANFGYDDKAEKFEEAYDLLKRSLALAGDYRAEQ